MTTPGSVLDKAVALRAEARRLHEGQKGAAEFARTSKAVTELDLLISALAHAVQAARPAAVPWRVSGSSIPRHRQASSRRSSVT